MRKEKKRNKGRTNETKDVEDEKKEERVN